MKTVPGFQIVAFSALLALSPGCSKQSNSNPANPVAASPAARNPTATNVAVAPSGAVGQAADGRTVYQAKPGSKIRMEGTSNIHDWQVEGTIIGGTVEVGPNFPLDPTKATPGKVDAKANVIIPVRSMKSIEKDGKPYNAKMDDIMYEKLLEPTNKAIKFVLSEFVVKETSKAASDPVVFEAKGELTVAGKTNTVTMPVKMTVLPQDKLKFSGSVGVKMTDFGITPPNPLGLGIETGDDVKLIFDWMTGKKAP